MTTPTPKFTGVLRQLSTLRYASTEKHNSVVLYCSHGLLTGWPITRTITSVTTRSDKTPLLVLIAVGSYYADFYYKRYRFFKRNSAQTVLYYHVLRVSKVLGVSKHILKRDRRSKTTDLCLYIWPVYYWSINHKENLEIQLYLRCDVVIINRTW